MGDGAHLGVSARRALDTILGGEESPGEAEQQSPQEVLARVLSAPLPLEGESPYERADVESSEAYAMVADSIAHAFLVLEGEDPGVLDRDTVYPDDFEIVELRGKSVGVEHSAWEAMLKRWPGADEWLGGATGFQVGFALNSARYVRGEPPVPNPAIVEIETP